MALVISLTLVLIIIAEFIWTFVRHVSEKVSPFSDVDDEVNLSICKNKKIPQLFIKVHSIKSGD